MAEPVTETFTCTGGAGTIVGDRWVPPADAKRVDPYGRPKAPILMLHGGAQTRHAWTRAARHLSGQGYEVTTVDARGHGDSDWAPDGDYAITLLADDLVQIVAARYPGEEKPVLVGASLGGLTGMIALGRGDAVGRALVLVDVSPNLQAAGVDRVGAFMKSGLEGFDSIEEVADAVAAYQPHRPRPKTIEGLKKNLRQREDGRWYWHWDPAFAANANGEMAQFGAEFLERHARGVELPTMLLRGKHSDVIGEDAGDRLRELIPHVYTHQVEEAGHMIVGDDNAKFLGNMEWFLDQVARSEAGI